jgi:hypothetical protein
MTLRRVFYSLLRLIIFASITTLARADSWTYTLSATKAVPGANGLSIGFQSSLPVSGSTTLFSSQSNACTNCLRQANNLFMTPMASNALNFTSPSPVSYRVEDRRPNQLSGSPSKTEIVTGETAQGGVSSSMTPESSSLILLLGVIACIFVGVRGKANRREAARTRVPAKLHNVFGESY